MPPKSGKAAGPGRGGKRSGTGKPKHRCAIVSLCLFFRLSSDFCLVLCLSVLFALTACLVARPSPPLPFCVLCFVCHRVPVSILSFVFCLLLCPFCSFFSDRRSRSEARSATTFCGLCSVFCVLRSAFCALLPAFCVLRSVFFVELLCSVFCVLCSVLFLI